jgi:peptidoglycan/LPS O-acetylase OafA/YrhL
MGEIRSHTGLRGIAALLVIFYHFHYLQPHLPFEAYTAFFRRSYLMVDLFFILSGFIISYVYNVAGKPLLPYGEFLMRRLIRLYPLHLFCLLLLVAFFSLLLLGFDYTGRSVVPFWDKPDALGSFLAQLFMVHAFLPSAPRWNIPSWSISAEMAAYAVFPLLALAFRSRSALASAGCIAFSVVYYGYIATHGGSLDITHFTAPLRCLAGFTMGMVIHNYRFALNRLNGGLLSAIQIVASVAVILLMAREGNDVALIVPFLLLVFSTWTDKGAVAALLRGRICHFLGEISYSVYLIHVPLLVFLYPIHVFIFTKLHLDPMTIRALWFLLATPGILLAAWMSYKLVEVPARRWLTRKWNGRSSVRVTAMKASSDSSAMI